LGEVSGGAEVKGGGGKGGMTDSSGAGSHKRGGRDSGEGMAGPTPGKYRSSSELDLY